MKKFTLLLLLAFSTAFSVYAQQNYTAFVGSFVDIRPQDFDKIRPLGFLYAQQQDVNLNQVFMGNFTEKSKADQLTAMLKGHGFTNAQVVAYTPAEGQQMAVIQIATRYTNRRINWNNLKRAGELNVMVENERVKVYTVTYPDINTAKNALARIQALGFSDAFVKTVNSARLIPVTAISTGIKEDLIPLNLSETPVQQPTKPTAEVIPENFNTEGAQISTKGVPSVPRPTSTETKPANEVVLTPKDAGTAIVNNNSTPAPSQPAAYETTKPDPIVTPAPAPTKPVVDARLPQIRGKVKRSSAVNLQKLLKQEGYYDSSIDGYYGPGTSKAHDRMWANDVTVAKYRLLSENMPKAENTSDAFLQWPEMKLLYATAMDLNPRAASQNSKLNAAAVKRYQLSLTEKPFDPAQAALLNNWHTSVWNNIDQWASTDPFLLNTTNALRFAYYQSQVRLEDYYMDKGFGYQEAKTLALASLQATVGVAFERFQ